MALPRLHTLIDELDLGPDHKLRFADLEVGDKYIVFPKPREDAWPGGFLKTLQFIPKNRTCQNSITPFFYGIPPY